ncbi:cytochrome c [uncultured Roseobacter sp.]|uniref:c-type cytochrome n=1 Tax=uncultured Roseobacter sp. TaxID=114847 RepID=UPI00260622F1|nr:cytochrome c [uncultured Roseobacter sp.]
MKKLTIIPLISALVLTAAVGSALGDGHADKDMAAAIKARKAQMTLISHNMGILGGMAKGQIEFDTARASAAAESLASVARLDRSLLWVEGSIQGDVPDTRAKAEIWSDAAGFEKAATGLETAADGLVAVAGQDLAALQAAMKAAGESCGVCHKAYRGPKN